MEANLESPLTESNSAPSTAGQRLHRRLAQEGFAQPPHIHPLLAGATTARRGFMQQIDLVLCVCSPFYIGDHRVHATPVIPAAFYMELLLGLGQTVLGDARPAVEDMVIREAVPLYPRHRRKLRINLHAVRDVCDTYCVTIETAQTNRQIASARLCPSIDTQTPQAMRPATSPSSTATSCAFVYRRLHAAGLHYGPYFQSLRTVASSQELLIGEVSLPSALRFGAERYLLHPVLLDGCFHALAAGCLDETLSTPYLPFRLQRLTAYRPAMADVHCVVKLHSFMGRKPRLLTCDLQILTPCGQVVADMNGLQLLRLSNAARAVFAPGPAI